MLLVLLPRAAVGATMTWAAAAERGYDAVASSRTEHVGRALDAEPTDLLHPVQRRGLVPWSVALSPMDTPRFATNSGGLADDTVLVRGGWIKLGGQAGEFEVDELAQLTYQHVGAGDIAGRPTLAEITETLQKATPTALEGQNAVQFERNGVRVIINEDAPTKSTAYYPGR